MHVSGNNSTYFDSFGVRHILKEIKRFIGNDIIKANIYRIQAYDSIMCGYFYIGFVAFTLNNKRLADFTNSFLLNKFNKQYDEIILKYFQ